MLHILMVLLLANPAAYKNKMSYKKNKIQRLKVIVSLKEKFPRKNYLWTMLFAIETFDITLFVINEQFLP